MIFFWYVNNIVYQRNLPLALNSLLSTEDFSRVQMPQHAVIVKGVYGAGG